MRVTLLRYKCIGCAYCTSLAPELFALSHADGKVTLRHTSDFDIETQTEYIGMEEESLVRQAIAICPTKAIKLA